MFEARAKQGEPERPSFFPRVQPHNVAVLRCGGPAAVMKEILASQSQLVA